MALLKCSRLTVIHLFRGTMADPVQPELVQVGGRSFGYFWVRVVAGGPQYTERQRVRRPVLISQHVQRLQPHPRAGVFAAGDDLLPDRTRPRAPAWAERADRLRADGLLLRD